MKDTVERLAQTPPRPALNDTGPARQYLRSYLVQRLVIGLLGLTLPAILVVKTLQRSGDIEGSLSGYYYTDARDLFVGALIAVGVFLMTYMVLEKNLDNFFSLAAGLGALVVALVPTGAPSGVVRFQTLPVWMHFTAAALFIGSLGVISARFGYGERRRTDPVATHRVFWSWFHYGCAIVILLAVLFIVVTHNGFDKSLLVGESVAVAAFGVSWTAKGSELFKWLTTTA